MSFYVYETEAESKCERCNANERYEDAEFCEPCIHEMITPRYSPVAEQLLAEHIRKEGAE